MKANHIQWFGAACLIATLAATGCTKSQPAGKSGSQSVANPGTEQAESKQITPVSYAGTWQDADDAMNPSGIVLSIEDENFVLTRSETKVKAVSLTGKTAEVTDTCSLEGRLRIGKKKTVLFSLDFLNEKKKGCLPDGYVSDENGDMLISMDTDGNLHIRSDISGVDQEIVLTRSADEEDFVDSEENSQEENSAEQ